MDVGHRVWDGGGQDGDPQHDPQQIPKAQDVQGGSGELTFAAVGGLHTTDIPFLLPTQQSWVQIPPPPRCFLFTP